MAFYWKNSLEILITSHSSLSQQISFFFLVWLQDLVGLVISMLLLGDFSLVLLTLLQLYSFSLLYFFLVLFILPLGILLPFPAGINALFSHGPRRSAGLARVYALWNIISLINVVSCNICSLRFRLSGSTYSWALISLLSPNEHIGWGTYIICILVAEKSVWRTQILKSLVEFWLE